MNTYRSMKDALDFDYLKKQRSFLDSKIESKYERIIRHPEDKEIVENDIKELKRKARSLDSLIEKEPPLPELPPKQALIKVSGVLDRIETLFVKGYFTDREYEPDEFSRQEAHRQWGSILQAIFGDSVAASINAQNEVRKNNSYDFIQGEINGKPFYGWLGYCTARVGDRVELAAVDKGTHLEVYALAIPELRTVTTLPCCSYGVLGKVKSDLLATCAFVFLAVTLVFFVIIFSVDNFFDAIKFFTFSFIFTASIMTLISLALIPRVLKKPQPTVKLAQSIFTTLKIDNPANVNLHKSTRKKLRYIKCNKISVPIKGRVMPDKSSDSSFYFYY